MRAGIGAVRNAVAVDVLVAAEILAGLEILGGHDLAAIVLTRIVPFERRGQALVHADVEIAHDEDRRLQAVGKIERERRELEAFVRVFRKQQHVLRVAVRGVRRKPARRTAAACASACRSTDRRAARR